MIISHVENVSLLSNTTCMYVCIDLFSVCIFSFFVFPVTIVFGLRYCHFTIFHFLFLFLSFRSSRIDDCTLFVLWIMELVVAVIFSIYITIGKSEQNLYSCINMENKSIKQKSKREQSQNEAFRKWYKYLSGLYVYTYIRAWALTQHRNNNNNNSHNSSGLVEWAIKIHDNSTSMAMCRM